MFVSEKRPYKPCPQTIRAIDSGDKKKSRTPLGMAVVFFSLDPCCKVERVLNPFKGEYSSYKSFEAPRYGENQAAPKAFIDLYN
jgi:hypothetical protein